ncbi:MAG: hypothetical protein EP323_00210 [Gammaproteobacteria bacterium]|nr:MAG: hypothetical protein EP323_00210 [Gammaproteobacteria bacterium]
MGDADWLREVGLDWGWEDNYPDFREHPTKRQRWAARPASQVNEDPECVATAAELVAIKQEILRLQNQEKALKEMLLEKLERGQWVSILSEESESIHIVERCKPSPRKQLNTQKALRFVRKRLGRDAAGLMAEECAMNLSSRDAIYVRLGLEAEECPKAE